MSAVTVKVDLDGSGTGPGRTPIPNEVDIMTIKLMRDSRPEANTVFWAAPFGTKMLANGEPFDFDAFFAEVIVPTCTEVNMKVLRADQVYGKGDVAETAWHGIQLAPLVLVDFSARSCNVAAEFALSLALGKRIIVLAQDPDDIPSDVRGHFRYIQYGNGWQSMQRLRTELGKELPATMEQSSTEMILVPMHNGGMTPVPGEVVIADREFVMVLTDDRRRVVLNAADVDARRIISDMAKRFPVGTRVEGSFEVDLAGDTKYTLIPGQLNPWPALESAFGPGTEFRSRVDSVVPGLGVFVHVGHGVNGLVPEHKLGGRQVVVGDNVEVAVTTFDADRRRIGLRLDRILQAVPAVRSVPVARSSEDRADHTGGRRSGQPALPDVGDTFLGSVTRIVPEGEGAGGFILLRVAGLQRTVMLHCTSMTEDLRADLRDGFVELGEEIALEVIKVDQRDNKVLVMDLPDPDSASADRRNKEQDVLAAAS
jgi:small subunit ribosomal protein S1